MRYVKWLYFIPPLIFAGVADVDRVWVFANIAVGVCAIPNLVAVLALSGVFLKLMQDYLSGRNEYAARSHRCLQRVYQDGKLDLRSRESMRVFIINPNSDEGMTAAIQKSAEGYAGDDFDVVCESTPGAPRFIETYQDEVMAAPGMVDWSAATRKISTRLSSPATATSTWMSSRRCSTSRWSASARLR